jgi:hypothetical protein
MACGTVEGGQNDPVRWSAVCRVASDLPEVLPGRSYGIPVLAVRGSFMARLSDDGRSILVKAEHDEGAALCASNPRTFSPGGPLWNGSTVAVRLATVERQELWDVLVSAWRRSAPPSLVAGGEAPTRGPAR